jgi:hypothetical protein
MLFTTLVGLTAMLVAGCAAYFSVVGIATLFAGHFTQVLVMASALEIGKIVATSFLYRYWNKTILLLKLYLISAVIVLVCITSMGIFGYLSSGYQVNRGKTELVETQSALIEEQKTTIEQEIEQARKRINTLNNARATQEQRLPTMSRVSAAPVYEDIKRAGEEISTLNSRIQDLQGKLLERDNSLIELKKQTQDLHDIGTFKFVAEAFNTELDVVVKLFILVIVLVFDPLAVALVLAYNIAAYGNVHKTRQTTSSPNLESNVRQNTTTDLESNKKDNNNTPTIGIGLHGHIKG